MLVPQPDHSFIIVRNFFTVFVTISLMIYIHMGLNEATSSLQDANAIIKSILNNETYTITQQRLFNLQQSLKEKSYHELAQTECLVKVYLDVRNNEVFLEEAKDKKGGKQVEQQSSNDDKIELKFTELVFPMLAHSLEGFKNCSDILTLMNFLNPTKTDFIYTKFMEQKYGAFIEDSQTKQTKSPQNPSPHPQTKFCLFTTQFNTSTTKLRQNINSITQQSYQNYKLLIIDNGSTDGSYQIAKVILSDLKGKLTSENKQHDKDQVKKIEEKYQIIKEESKLGIWELYDKHEAACEGTDFVVFVDGRDQLPTRHTLNILNHEINIAKQRPWIVTAPMLKRRQLSRQSPADLSSPQKPYKIPTYTFKILSLDLLKQTKNKLKQLTQNATHSFQVQKLTIQTLSNYITANYKPVLKIDQMMYVYDTIENKQVERNEYYVAVVRKELASKKKVEKKNEKK